MWSVDRQCRPWSWEIYTFYCFMLLLSKTKKVIDSPHVHLDFSGMSNSLAMVDRAEIEQLKPFLKEKARH